MTSTHYRQGDVLLVRVEEIPTDAVPVEDGPVEGRHVVAYGEVTGHHHSVAVADARMVKSAEDIYLEIMAETTLDHQEHAPITLAPGKYRYVAQREYSPEAIRRVVD